MAILCKIVAVLFFLWGVLCFKSYSMYKQAGYIVGGILFCAGGIVSYKIESFIPMVVAYILAMISTKFIPDPTRQNYMTKTDSILSETMRGLVREHNLFIDNLLSEIAETDIENAISQIELAGSGHHKIELFKDKDAMKYLMTHWMAEKKDRLNEAKIPTDMPRYDRWVKIAYTINLYFEDGAPIRWPFS